MTNDIFFSWSLFHCFFVFFPHVALVIKPGLSYIKCYIKKHFLLNCSLKQSWLFPLHLLKNSYSDKYYWCSIYEPAKYFLGTPTSCWVLCNSHPINSFSNLKKNHSVFTVQMLDVFSTGIHYLCTMVLFSAKWYYAYNICSFEVV